MWKLLTIICVALVACNSSDKSQITSPATEPVKKTVAPRKTYPSDEVNAQLDGKWKWCRTDCCGRLKRIQWADTSKTQVVLEFETKYREVKRFENDRQVKTDNYAIEYGLLGGDRPTIRIGNGRSALLQFKEDTLLLNYQYMDLQIEYYVKQK